ncbi:MAG: DMT family transporter [Nitrospirales bacterium]|nr:DMT family transporter [Nitrospirales bacterium]
MSVSASYVSLTCAAMVWGGSVVAQKVALGPFSPVETSVFRGLGALAILIPLWLWTEGPMIFSLKDWKTFFVLGLGVLGNHLLILFGLQFIGAGAAGVIIGSSPAITAFLSSVILKDIALRVIWVGCLVSFVGVLFITGRSGIEGVGSNPLLGGGLVLSGLVCWALYTIGCRRTMERFSPLAVTWITLSVSLIFEIPLLLFNHKVLVAGFESVPLFGWAALVYVMVFATAVGQQAWLYGVEGVGPSRAGIFGNLIPVSALLFSFMILGESVGFRELTGIGLIVFGVWLVDRQSREELGRITTPRIEILEEREKP